MPPVSAISPEKSTVQASLCTICSSKRHHPANIGLMALHRLSKSIATRLILCGIAIVFVGSLVRYAVLSHIMKEDIHSLVVSQQRSITDYMARDVEQRLSRRQAALKDVASAIPRDLLSQPAALQRWLAARPPHAWFPGDLQYLDAAAVGRAEDPFLSGVLSGKPLMASARYGDHATVSLSFASGSDRWRRCRPADWPRSSVHTRLAGPDSWQPGRPRGWCSAGVTGRRCHHRVLRDGAPIAAGVFRRPCNTECRAR